MHPLIPGDAHAAPTVNRLRRARHRRAAHGLAAAISSSQVFTFLEVNRVRPSTAINYNERGEAFRQWVEEAQMPLDDASLLDNALCEYFEHLYFEGFSHVDGDKLIAALKYNLPLFTSDERSLLPRARAALRGFRRLAPSRSCAPLPWIALMGMVGAALFAQRPDIVLGLLLQFLCYLRPGELVGLKRGQVIAPQSASFTNHWALLLVPEEEVVTSKTKEFDESVLIDWPELWGLHRLLQRHAAPLGNDDAMWTFDHKEYNRMFGRVSELAEVNKLAPHPYSLRHGGASHDSLLRRRSIEAIQKRGRWRAASSATRYDKQARVLKGASKLGQRARCYGEYVFKNLNSLLAGHSKLEPPPAVQRSQLNASDAQRPSSKRKRSASAGTPAAAPPTSPTRRSRKFSRLDSVKL